MSKLEQVEEQVKRLSPAEQEALRDWLENLLEDRLELKDDFKAEIETGIRDVAEGRYRVHRP
jgi:mRNA-degrading endonuclease RelE of RelBE toxin-antitoxin system